MHVTAEELRRILEQHPSGVDLNILINIHFATRVNMANYGAFMRMIYTIAATHGDRRVVLKDKDEPKTGDEKGDDTHGATMEASGNTSK